MLRSIHLLFFSCLVASSNLFGYGTFQNSTSNTTQKMNERGDSPSLDRLSDDQRKPRHLQDNQMGTSHYYSVDRLSEPKSMKQPGAGFSRLPSNTHPSTQESVQPNDKRYYQPGHPRL